MNIILTGATGFIGRHLLERLLGEGHRCRCLVRTLPAGGIFDQPDVELFVGDLSRPATLEAIGIGMDAACHLAAAGHVSAVSPEAFRAVRETNVEGTANIARACALGGVKRFIHFSSTAAMGLIRAPMIDEAAAARPRTPYQKSKLEGETAALDAGRRSGMETIILRPCMVYGPGGRGEFLKFCRLVRKGLFPRIGRGENRTPLVHVRDVVEAALAALHLGRSGEVYLVASETSPPLAEIFSSISESLSIRRRSRYVPFPVAYAGALLLESLAASVGRDPVVSRWNIVSAATGRIFDIGKARRELGYEPRVGLRDGIREAVDWYRKEGLI
jgi:nucleoside-diphosphate-sugar epimerase